MLPILEKKSNLYMNYYPIIAKILAEEEEGTFKQRQAKGAMEELEKHVKRINEKLKGERGYFNFEKKDTELAKMENGRIVLDGEIKSELVEMLKQPPVMEYNQAIHPFTYYRAKNVFTSIASANLTWQRLTKRALDTIEMVEEEEETADEQ